MGINMTKVKIVTDSACTMEPGMAEKLGIKIVSLSVMVDDVIYRDADLDGDDFMDMMANAKALPKTSQPPIGEFVEAYDELGKDVSSVISIHLTNLLSGTVEAARQAAQISKTDVTVIDSTFADQGTSFQVIRAAEMALEGATKEEIIQEVEKVKENTTLYIGVASLDNLVKGGRISRATGVLSNVFNIRVVMQLLDTGLETMSKGRGAKAFIRWFEEVKKDMASKNNIRAIGISHANGLEIATYYKEELQKLFPNMHIPVLTTSSTISTHTGKGAFAIMYYTD